MTEPRPPLPRRAPRGARLSARLVCLSPTIKEQREREDTHRRRTSRTRTSTPEPSQASQSQPSWAQNQRARQRPQSFPQPRAHPCAPRALPSPPAAPDLPPSPRTMVQVYAEPYARRHYAPYLSFAALFRVAVFVLAVAAALMAAYSTGGFYVTDRVYHEQPKVRRRRARGARALARSKFAKFGSGARVVPRRAGRRYHLGGAPHTLVW